LKLIPQSIPEILIIQPQLHGDDRGYFAETFRQDILEEYTGKNFNFVQDNESKSSKGILRGLHYQLNPYSQSKLVRVIEGKILDVCLDIRKSSKTFAKHVSVELSSDNKKQLFVPHGFAHGFIVLSDTATVVYKVDNYYSPKYERGIAFDDKELSIDWVLPKDIIKLSDKDKSLPLLANAEELFE